MKYNKKIMFSSLIISLLSPVGFFMIYDKLPDMMPTKYSFAGEIIKYSPKDSLWILALLPVLLLPFLYIMPKIDPKGEKYKNVLGFYQFFILGMTIFLTLLNILMFSQSLYPNSINIGSFVLVCIGLIFIFLGNYMPKMKQNYTMGIKTPWTLENQVVWYKTHRLGGKCFILGGILFFIGAVFEKLSVIMFVISILLALVPSVASYIYYKQETK